MLQLFLANKNLIYSVLSKILMLRKEITIVLQIIQTPKKTTYRKQFQCINYQCVSVYQCKKTTYRKQFIIVFLKRDRNSRSQMYFKIGVFKNFANFTGKHLCWSLFLIKLQARDYFYRKTFFTDHLRWLLLKRRERRIQDPKNYP